MGLYASGPKSRIYHTVLERGKYTLCGLKVVELKSNVPTEGTGLYILLDTPKNGALCKHCERLAETEFPHSV
jgi:hypothetical protein